MVPKVTGYSADESVRLAIDVADVPAGETIVEVVGVVLPPGLAIREAARDVVADADGVAGRAVAYWLDPTPAGNYAARWRLRTSGGELIAFTVRYQIEAAE